MELTKEQREELERVSRQAVGRVALRAQMVLLLDRKFSVPQIARIHDCGCDVVRTWLHRYAQAGIAGLEDLPRSGRPPKHPFAKEIVDAQASQSPECSGHVHTRWTVGCLTTFLAQRFGLRLSPDSVRRHLHLADWRWARPRLAPAKKRDPEADTKQAALDAALRLAARGLARVIYFDECDLHLLPVVRAMWMKGPRVRIPTPGTNAKRAFFGALEAASGRWLWADHDRKLAVHFAAFLEQVAQSYPEGPLYLVMDNARIHTAKVVERWLAANPRIQVQWLPKYRAHEVNPVERIWGLMKDAVAADRLAGKLSILTATANRFFREDLAPHPVALPKVA